MSWIFNEKGTYFGRVADPTTAKLAPYLNVDPIDSRYGLNRLPFTLSQRKSMTRRPSERRPVDWPKKVRPLGG